MPAGQCAGGSGVCVSVCVCVSSSTGHICLSSWFCVWIICPHVSPSFMRRHTATRSAVLPLPLQHHPPQSRLFVGAFLSYRVLIFIRHYNTIHRRSLSSRPFVWNLGVCDLLCVHHSTGAVVFLPRCRLWFCVRVWAQLKAYWLDSCVCCVISFKGSHTLSHTHTHTHTHSFTHSRLMGVLNVPKHTGMPSPAVMWDRMGVCVCGWIW